MRGLLLICVLALLLRAFPVINGGFLGPDPYFHTRMAETIIEQQSVPEWDDLSYSGRAYTYQPLFHTMIASFSLLSGMEPSIAGKLLSLLSGILSVVLVFVFARKLTGNYNIAIMSSLFLTVMSPHVFRTFAYPRADSLSLFMIPLLLYLMLEKRFMLASVLAVPVAMLHPVLSMGLIIFCMFITGFTSEFRALAPGAVAVAVFVLYMLLSPVSPAMPTSFYFSSAEFTYPSVLFLFTGFFPAILFLAFPRVEISESYRFRFFAIWFAVTAIFAVLLLRFTIFVTMPLAILAGMGYNNFMKRFSKFAAPAVVILLLLLSYQVWYLSGRYGVFMSEADEQSLVWMRYNTPGDSVVLSVWSLGHPVSQLSRRKNVMDGYWEFRTDLEERDEDIGTVMNTGSYDTAKPVLEKYNVNYIYVGGKYINLKYGLYEYEKALNKIYDNGNARIYEIIS
jgi:hypothetical protein